MTIKKFILERAGKNIWEVTIGQSKMPTMLFESSVSFSDQAWITEIFWMLDSTELLIKILLDSIFWVSYVEAGNVTTMNKLDNENLSFDEKKNLFLKESKILDLDYTDLIPWSQFWWIFLAFDLVLKLAESGKELSVENVHKICWFIVREINNSLWQSSIYAAEDNLHVSKWVSLFMFLVNLNQNLAREANDIDLEYLTNFASTYYLKYMIMHPYKIANWIIWRMILNYIYLYFWFDLLILHSEDKILHDDAIAQYGKNWNMELMKKLFYDSYNRYSK